MGIPMRLIRSFFLFLSVILLGAGCGSGRKSGEGAGEAFRIEYARHYRVEHFRDYTLVDVLSPWDSLRLLRRYVLVDRERPLPVDFRKEISYGRRCSGSWFIRPCTAVCWTNWGWATGS